MSKVINISAHIDIDEDGNVEGMFNLVHSRCPRCYAPESLIILEQRTLRHTLTHSVLRMKLKCICCDYKTTGEFNVEA